MCQTKIQNCKILPRDLNADSNVMGWLGPFHYMEPMTLIFANGKFGFMAGIKAKELNLVKMTSFGLSI